MTMKKITVIVPCFNEIRTLPTIYEKLASINFGPEKEIIYVDDCSVDGSREFLKQRMGKNSDTKMLFHEKNMGKGAAIRSALNVASGDYVIIQDADLEYNPEDIKKMISEADRGGNLVVYGSRHKEVENTYLYWHYYVGVKFLTFLINKIFRQNITDPETCYKLIDRNLLQFLDIQEDGFGIEIELTAKISRIGLKIKEVGISYTPRSYHEGKKIKIRDGIRAYYLLFRYALYRSQHRPDFL